MLQSYIFQFLMGVTLFFAPFAQAQNVENVETEKAALSFVESFGNQALEILQKNTDDDHEESHFRTLLQENFDIRTIGRFVLGRYWKVATPAQREEYLSLFEDMIINIYARRLKDYSGETLKFIKSRREGRRDTIVSSLIKRPEGPDVHVRWRVRKKDNSYRIIDVIVEGISMSVTQRSEFQTIIESGNGGVETLLETLRDSVNKKIATAEIE